MTAKKTQDPAPRPSLADRAAEARAEVRSMATVDEDGERPAGEDIEATVLELTRVSIKARAAGHSLTDILATAAKNAFGIDVR